MYLTHTADSREEEGSDDNRSSSLGRSAQSDDASDYQDDGGPECELTTVSVWHLNLFVEFTKRIVLNEGVNLIGGHELVSYLDLTKNL